MRRLATSDGASSWGSSQADDKGTTSVDRGSHGGYGPGGRGRYGGPEGGATMQHGSQAPLLSPE